MEKTELKIPVSQLTVIKCPVCKNETFNVLHRLRKLPAVYSPTGQVNLLIETVYQCIFCFGLYTKENFINQKTE